MATGIPTLAANRIGLLLLHCRLLGSVLCLQEVLITHISFLQFQRHWMMNKKNKPSKLTSESCESGVFLTRAHFALAVYLRRERAVGLSFGESRSLEFAPRINLIKVTLEGSDTSISTLYPGALDGNGNDRLIPILNAQVET
jgi:hypothetical protein